MLVKQKVSMCVNFPKHFLGIKNRQHMQYTYIKKTLRQFSSFCNQENVDTLVSLLQRTLDLF